MENKLTYLVGIYGYLQLSMLDVGLLTEQGQVIKAKHNMSEQDALYIYKWVGEHLLDVDKDKLRRLAQETDKKVSKLLNDHKEVNNFLLAILLLREYLDNHGSKVEQLMILPKVNRLVDVVDGAVSDEAFNPMIKRTTARTANNIYRQHVGRPQLSDEVWGARFKGIKGRLHDIEK